MGIVIRHYNSNIRSRMADKVHIMHRDNLLHQKKGYSLPNETEMKECTTYVVKRFLCNSEH